MASETTSDPAAPPTDNVSVRKEPNVNAAELGEHIHGDISNPSEAPTSRAELWAWWAYYFGNNSSGPGSYTPLIFQSVLNSAGWSPGRDRALGCADPSLACVVDFGTRTTPIETVVLVSNGIAFAIQGFVLLCFGTISDYGSLKRWIFALCTVVCWGVQFGFLGLKRPEQYHAAIALNIISTLSYNLAVAFWQPSLPTLARNTRPSLEADRALATGTITPSDHKRTHMLQRNKVSNFAFASMSVGYTITLLIALGVAYGLNADASSTNNLRAATIIVGITVAIWILFGTPWLILEKQRTVPLPPGETYFSLGPKVYWALVRRMHRIPQTWLYLAGYFFLSDGTATTNQLFVLCQNSIVAYSTTVSTQLYIVQGVANFVGIAVIWLIQRHFQLRTKSVIMVLGCFALLIPTWGCIGIGTEVVGYHHIWEIWLFSVLICAVVAPLYAFTASMLGDVIPRGREVTFFAIYSVVGKSTAWIGPIISGVIIDRAGGRTWVGFPFSLALTAVGVFLISCVKVDRAREQCEAWEKAERDGEGIVSGSGGSTASSSS
ncbi:autophagy-related protein 22-like protein [Aspergillus karnatakaensis]|uniref:MFS transporter n=1 Tax=Aspergillus karnatakaensis TaxID=1810916 RepID=UPI003CCDEF33